MDSKKIARVLLCRCCQNKKLFGITIEKRTGNNWDMMYSYPMDEDRIESENFDQGKITATFDNAPSFVGCPFCGNMGLFQCGVCERFSCHSGKETENSVTCTWCGDKLNLIHIDSTETDTGAD